MRLYNQQSCHGAMLHQFHREISLLSREDVVACPTWSGITDKGWLVLTRCPAKM
jgi:hypothetical protein